MSRILREKGRFATVEGWRALALAPRRIALVSRDWIREATNRKSTFSDPNMGLQPHVGAIMEICDRAQCDTVLCAPWTNNVSVAGPISHHDLFPTGTKHSTVVIGNCLTSWRDEWIEVWSRNFLTPIRYTQRFATSEASVEQKRQFLQHLEKRILGSMGLVICGETNILHLRRDDQVVVDHFGALPLLAARDVHVILNPVHDYMRRYEMPLKRRALSAGRLVVSVWNRGCKNGGEAATPWQVFRDLQNMSHEVDELVVPTMLGSGVRIGVARLDEVG